MLLQKLKEYADEQMVGAFPPPLYAMTPIRYIVEIAEDGAPRNPEPTPTGDAKNARTRRGDRRLAPDVVRAGIGEKPLLLADHSEYTFGHARDPAKQTRANACHRAYLDLLNECARTTGEPAIRSVLAFYERGGAAQLRLADDFDLGAKVTFRVHSGLEGVFPIDLPSVQQFWAARHDPETAGAPTMQCLVCGNQRPVLDRLQSKIKGVRGGQSSGTSIISANADAFTSYGLEASLIAPTCADCGERFTRAANELIEAEKSHLYLGNTTFIFWTRKPSTFSLTIFLTQPDEGEVQRLIDSVRTGKRTAEFNENLFYAAALSGSGGRTVVRDWIDTTVGAAQESLAHWFDLQEIIDWNGAPGRPLGLFALATATVRKADDLPVTTPRALLSSAVTGKPVPLGLLFEAVRRNRAEQHVTHNRAALIKLVLLSQDTSQPTKEKYMVALTPNHPDVAYHCGRLLAVLEKIQEGALPNAKATIIDRFFGTASSAPASVFGRLLRGAQPHLSTLERDKRGAYVNLQRELEDVLQRVPGFPKTLTLQQQGLFSLGYYHQRSFRAPKPEAVATNTGNTQTEGTND